MSSLPFFPLQAAEVSNAADVSNQLGLRLFTALGNSEPNLCISPYSITAALAMTYQGSAGVTRSQMASALGFPMEPLELALGFRELDAALLPENSEVLTLRRANRLFGQTGFSFREAFLQSVETNFQAPLEETNFEADPAAATGRINSWVEEITAEKIRNLIPDGAITKDTTLVLVNALYFLAAWDDPFSESSTSEKPFYAASGQQTSVPMMRTNRRLFYQKTDLMEAVTIPYRGGEFQLVILLPSETPMHLVSALSPSLLKDLTQLPARSVDLSLPKFRLEPPTISLKDALVGLGMPSAFDDPQGSADFDAMAPRRPNDYLYLSNVFHKTFLAIDEKGTEAAAATAVVMMRMSAAVEEPEPPVVVNVNRPFVFLIQHVPSATVLFLGRVSQL